MTPHAPQRSTHTENETDNRAQLGAFPSAKSPSRAVVAERSSAQAAATINPNVIYFVLADFGPKIGRAFVERDPARMDRKSTVEDIANGAWGKGVEVVKVLECCEEGPIFFNRTEDILREAGVFVTDDAPRTGQDAIDWHNDHARELRKESV